MMAKRSTYWVGIYSIATLINVTVILVMVESFLSFMSEDAQTIILIIGGVILLMFQVKITKNVNRMKESRT